MEAIKKTAFSYFSRKLTQSGAPIGIKHTLLSRLSTECTQDNTAVNEVLCKDQIWTFVTMQAEVIKIQTTAKPTPLPTLITYHNINLPKEKAIEATKTLINPATQSEALIFTDGSFDSEKGGGAAAICLNTDTSLLLSTEKMVCHSNHECEIIGLLAAFNLIARFQPNTFHRHYIFTDNQGVILRIMNPLLAKPGQYIYKELLKVWFCFNPNTQIDIVWCPGHSGIQGNKLADRKANDAVTLGQTLPFPLLNSLTKAKGLILNKMIAPSCQLQSRIPTGDIRLTSILSQLASGCSSLNGYLF